MRHETHFNFGGRWSYEMGVVKANLGGGLFEDQIVSNKSITEERIEGREKPYFYRVDRDPLSFSLPIFFESDLSADKLRGIMRWLDRDTYQPFYMIDEPERLWYAMVIDSADIIHNGAMAGYMELTLRTDDTRTLTPYMLTKTYQIRSGTKGTVIEFENNGDFDCEPIVHIEKIGKGNLTIKNLSKDEKDFSFVDLQDKEKIYVDCEHKEIETDGLIHRYNYFSGGYLKIPRGINQLEIKGDCNIAFEAEFKTY